MLPKLLDSALAIKPLVWPPDPPAPDTLDAIDRFIGERCDVSPNGKMLFRDFCQALPWLPPTRRNTADKMRVRAALLSRGFTIQAGAHNQRYLHGLTLRTEEAHL